ncbi:hypothetical protein CSOJ01_00725 [Colletotrichum sojae]|uniref:BTB domain-containing protein n=1 Tax=Colletotrichum sojae TaxID=2175907 RepID=A0A8H6JW88_9PEZI|nr:hypothetical protein CSOJ01_00725 [Colletotrichum sojae]
MIYAGNTDASSIVSSDPFTFIVGPEKEFFQIHSVLVASLSEPLHKLVNLPLEEAKRRRAVWDHCDVETFAAFSEFAYTKRYSVPEFNDIGTLNGGSPPVPGAGAGAGAVANVDIDTP